RHIAAGDLKEALCHTAGILPDAEFETRIGASLEVVVPDVPALHDAIAIPLEAAQHGVKVPLVDEDVRVEEDQVTPVRESRAGIFRTGDSVQVLALPEIDHRRRQR